MAKKKHRPGWDAGWAKAKRVCRLSAEDVRMAKELGFKPKSLLKNNPSPSQPWKLPVREWIRELYAKKFNKAVPPPAAQRMPLETVEEMPADLDAESFLEDEGEGSDDFLEEPSEADDWTPYTGAWEQNPRNARKIEEENQHLLRRQREFRRAAECVARAFAEFPEVQKVVLFGSVARPLKKEVPRFREYRCKGIELFHECKDVDLAVWISDLSNLQALGKARARAVNALMRDEDIGVAHHQVDVFLMDPVSDDYLGRLCIFGECPKDNKLECLVPGCGEYLFLQLHAGFKLRRDALLPDRTILLFDRAAQVVRPSPAGPGAASSPGR